MDRYEKGTRVSWRWGAHTARGRIARVFEHDARRSSKEPAYMIEQEDGARVLKSHSELSKLT